MKTDVLIVGAGLTGLSIADQLEEYGIDFMLVEASDRLGGRILTEEVDGAYFDLGPTWFWPGQPRIAKLIERLGLRSFEQYSQGSIVFQDQTGAVFNNPGYASMQGYYRIEEGMESLITNLKTQISPLSICPNTTVQGIMRKPSHLEATIKTARGLEMTEAKLVVLAMPPRMVAKHIKFTPSLEDDSNNALIRIPTWMAGQAKILAIYDRPYWREAGLSGDGMSQKGPMVEIHDASPNEGGPYALFGFIGYPAKVRRHNAKALLTSAKNQLVSMYGRSMENPIDIRIQDWAQNGFVSSEADHISSGFNLAYGMLHELSDLWSGDLMIASTEMSHSFWGLLEGALEIAEKTSMKITNQI